MTAYRIGDVDPAMKVLAVIFIVGMAMAQCEGPPPSDGPVEHKCQTEVGLEKC